MANRVLRFSCILLCMLISTSFFLTGCTVQQEPEINLSLSELLSEDLYGINFIALEKTSIYESSHRELSDHQFIAAFCDAIYSKAWTPISFDLLNGGILLQADLYKNDEKQLTLSAYYQSSQSEADIIQLSRFTDTGEWETHWFRMECAAELLTQLWDKAEPIEQPS